MPTPDDKIEAPVPVGTGDLLGLSEAEEALQYIAESPDQQHGGFHPNAVLAAKSALEHLSTMSARLERVRNLGEVYIYPEDWCCAKMGGPPDIDAYEKVDLSDA